MFGFKRSAVKTIHVNEIDPLIGSIELIDIREPYEYRSGSIKSSKNIPMSTLLNKPDKYLKTDHPYYLICQSGVRSMNAGKILVNAGYDVISVSGGVGSYAGTKRQ